MTEWHRRGFFRAAGSGLWLSAARGVSLGAPGDPIPCKIVEQGSSRPTPARVRLTDPRGRDVVPLGHPSELAPDAQQGDVRFQSKRFAYVEGEFSVAPNSLPLNYQVIKGYEFVIQQGRILPEDLQKGAITIPLARWSSLAGENW